MNDHHHPMSTKNLNQELDIYNPLGTHQRGLTAITKNNSSNNNNTNNINNSREIKQTDYIGVEDKLNNSRTRQQGNLRIRATSAGMRNQPNK